MRNLINQPTNQPTKLAFRAMMMCMMLMGFGMTDVQAQTSASGCDCTLTLDPLTCTLTIDCPSRFQFSRELPNDGEEDCPLNWVGMTPVYVAPVSILAVGNNDPYLSIYVKNWGYLGGDECGCKLTVELPKDCW